MFSKEIFGARLRETRKQRGSTQGEVAAALGITSTQISDMEKGRRTTTLERLYQLCNYYDVSADYLLGLSDERRDIGMDRTAAQGSCDG